MGLTTPDGIPYPDGSKPVLVHVDMKSLADRVQALLVADTNKGLKFESGRIFTGASGYVVIAFARGFTATPNFVASVDYNGADLTCTTESVGTQYATIRTWYAGAAYGNVPVQWIAVGV